jgi:hypothetical protein
VQNDWIPWQTLEQRIPLDELPTFHREFLKLVRPDGTDWDAVFLRQIQGKVQATLKQLEREGKAKQETNELFVTKNLVPESFLKYIS